MSDYFWLALAVAFFLIVEGIFSGSEIALFSADPLALRKKAKKGDKTAALTLRLKAKPERILSTTLLMTSLSVVGTSTLITLVFHSRNVPYADLAAILVTSPLVVILGELIPKTLFQRNADQWVGFSTRLLSAFGQVLSVFTSALHGYTLRLSRVIYRIESLIGRRSKASKREELQVLLNWDRRETALHASERAMIQRIFEFEKIFAKEVQIPLIQVDAIDGEATLKEALETFIEFQHSRMPVYFERIDNLTGVLEFSDVARAADLGKPVRSLIQPALFVAGTQNLHSILDEMQDRDSRMAIVVDEHGGASGILTLEDIFEEIVGEIADEHDDQEEGLRKISESTWLVAAKTPIEELTENLGISLPEGDYETLGGFLIQEFGKIPRPGESLLVDLEHVSYFFEVKTGTARKIEDVLIAIPRSEEIDSVEDHD